MRVFWFVGVCCVLLLQQISGGAHTAHPAHTAYAADPATKHVLYIASYHAGIDWSDNLIKGIKAGLAEAKDSALSIEFMDTKWFPSKAHVKLFYEYLAKKYAYTTIDLIITSDDNALDLIKQYGQELFPGVPTVFCGANDISLTDIGDFPNLLGIREKVELEECVKVALQLHPDADRMYFVFDTTITGTKIYNVLKAIKKNFKGVTFLFLDSLSLPDLLKTIKGIRKNALIMYLFFYRDVAGDYQESDQVAQKIMRAAQVPVYCTTDLLLGKGPVGGFILSSYYHGLETGLLASRILNGENPDAMPRISTSPSRLMFDYPALVKAGVDPDTLPAGSIVLNRPASFYARYEIHIWVVAAALVTLTFMVILMGINILQRRKAQRELAATLDELQGIFENTQAGIVLLGPDRIIRRTNRRIAELFGLNSSEEVVGKNSREFHVSQESYETFAAKYLSRLRNGENVRTEYRFRRRDGLEIWAIAAGTAVSRATPPDLNRGVLFLLDDITDRKEAEMALERLNLELETKVRERTQALASQTLELKEANIRLKKLDYVKSAMISSVSHDLRTPLTSIRGFIKLIGKTFKKHFIPLTATSLNLQEKASKIAFNLEIVDHESARLTRLINDFLDLAKIESGQLVWRDVDLELDKLIGQALESARGQFSMHPEVRLELDLEEGLPKVHADDDRIMQVLLNLLNNAAKHTSQGTVTISARAIEDGFVCITVRDTGSGIPEDELPRIFEKFHQVGEGDTLPDQGKGSGLGLAICREIVNHYKGRIWVESEHGVGTTLSFTLPVAMPA